MNTLLSLLKPLRQINKTEAGIFHLLRWDQTALQTVNLLPLNISSNKASSICNLQNQLTQH